MTAVKGAPGDVKSSALWNLMQFGAGKFVTFVSTIILARLLAPEAFGLVAMALLAINVFDRLKDFGVGAALVQHKERFTQVAATGTTLTVATSVALGVSCLIGAPGLASLLGEPTLTPIVQALSVMLLVSGLAVVPDAALQRRMQFRRRLVPELGGATIKAVLSIGLAMAGLGVWSLVWGQIAGTIFTTAFYWVGYLRSEPGRLLGWSPDAARSLLRFGAPISGIALLSLVLDNIDYFVIGRRLGATQLGYYTMAFRLPELLVVSVCAVISQVLFSSFSRLQHDKPALQLQFLSAVSTVATITVPTGLGLAAAAPALVPVILGPEFGESIPLLQLLGVYAAIYSLSFHAGDVFKATGRTGLLLITSLAQLLCFVPALWVAAGYSTVAVAATFVVLHLIFTIVRLILVRYALDISMGRQWRSIYPSLLAGLCMAAGVVGLGMALPNYWPDMALLMVQIAFGVGVYVALMTIIDRPALQRCVALVRARTLGRTS